VEYVRNSQPPTGVIVENRRYAAPRERYLAITDGSDIQSEQDYNNNGSTSEYSESVNEDSYDDTQSFEDLPRARSTYYYPSSSYQQPRGGRADYYDDSYYAPRRPRNDDGEYFFYDAY
jgi:hypothetical protein